MDRYNHMKSLNSVESSQYLKSLYDLIQTMDKDVNLTEDNKMEIVIQKINQFYIDRDVAKTISEIKI